MVRLAPAFRLPEILNPVYRYLVTTAGTPRNHDVLIAGVPWPAYKLIALVSGLLVLLAVAALTASASAAVLSGAAVATVVWICAAFALPSS